MTKTFSSNNKDEIPRIMKKMKRKKKDEKESLSEIKG
jgi:hypothetical protein